MEEEESQGWLALMGGGVEEEEEEEEEDEEEEGLETEFAKKPRLDMERREGGREGESGEW